MGMVRGAVELRRIVKLTLASRSPWVVGEIVTGGVVPSSVKAIVIFW